MSTYFYNWPKAADFTPLPVFETVYGNAEKRFAALGLVALRDVVGCTDSAHPHYIDGNRSSGAYVLTPATTLFVSVRDVLHGVRASKVAVLCNRHAGVVKRLITQGKARGTSVALKAEPAALGVAVRTILDELVTKAEAEFDAMDKASKEARAAYIAENRVSHILKADTELSREPKLPIRLNTDEYGATTVIIGGGWGGRGELSVPDARRMGQALLDAAALAHDKNEKALGG